MNIVHEVRLDAENVRFHALLQRSTRLGEHEQGIQERMDGQLSPLLGTCFAELVRKKPLCPLRGKIDVAIGLAEVRSQVLHAASQVVSRIDA